MLFICLPVLSKYCTSTDSRFLECLDKYKLSWGPPQKVTIVCTIKFSNLWYESSCLLKYLHLTTKRASRHYSSQNAGLLYNNTTMTHCCYLLCTYVGPRTVQKALDALSHWIGQWFCKAGPIIIPILLKRILRLTDFTPGYRARIQFRNQFFPTLRPAWLSSLCPALGCTSCNTMTGTPIVFDASLACQRKGSLKAQQSLGSKICAMWNCAFCFTLRSLSEKQQK